MEGKRERILFVVVMIGPGQETATKEWCLSTVSSS